MNFKGGWYRSFLGGWLGPFQAVAEFLPAALGRKIRAFRAHAAAQTNPSPPLKDPLGDSNRTASATARVSVRARPRAPTANS